MSDRIRQRETEKYERDVEQYGEDFANTWAQARREEVEKEIERARQEPNDSPETCCCFLKFVLLANVIAGIYFVFREIFFPAE